MPKTIDMKKVLIVCSVLIAALVIGGYYMYNKPKESLDSQDAAYSLTADELFTAFEQDENAANAKYLNKIVEVTGIVSAFTTENGEQVVTLETSSGMFGVICRLEMNKEPVKMPEKGAVVKVKGLCTGMLMDVVLVQTVFVNN